MGAHPSTHQHHWRILCLHTTSNWAQVAAERRWQFNRSLPTTVVLLLSTYIYVWLIVFSLKASQTFPDDSSGSSADKHGWIRQKGLWVLTNCLFLEGSAPSETQTQRETILTHGFDHSKLFSELVSVWIFSRQTKLRQNISEGVRPAGVTVTLLKMQCEEDQHPVFCTWMFNRQSTAVWAPEGVTMVVTSLWRTQQSGWLTALLINRWVKSCRRGRSNSYQLFSQGGAFII